jgi:hypothetical protein
MTETFLVNYTINNIEWTCHMATHSLAVATDVSQELRTLGYRVVVQSVLINEDGKVEL